MFCHLQESEDEEEEAEERETDEEEGVHTKKGAKPLFEEPQVRPTRTRGPVKIYLTDGGRAAYD